MYEIWLAGGLPTYFSDTGCYDAQFRDSDGRGAPPQAVAVPRDAASVLEDGTPGHSDPEFSRAPRAPRNEGDRPNKIKMKNAGRAAVRALAKRR
jgi:hypothetical protein